VRVEKLLDDAAKTAGDPLKPVKPVSSSTVGFTDSFAAAVPEQTGSVRQTGLRRPRHAKN